MGTRFVNSRRTFLGQALLLLVGLGRFGRRAWAQAYDSVRYQPLARPVVVPLDDLTMPGKAFPFTADGVTLPSAATPNQPVRMNGMVGTHVERGQLAGALQGGLPEVPARGM